MTPKVREKPAASRKRMNEYERPLSPVTNAWLMHAPPPAWIADPTSANHTVDHPPTVDLPGLRAYERGAPGIRSTALLQGSAHHCTSVSSPSRTCS